MNTNLRDRLILQYNHQILMSFQLTGLACSENTTLTALTIDNSIVKEYPINEVPSTAMITEIRMNGKMVYNLDMMKTNPGIREH